MDTEIIHIYCFVCDLLDTLGAHDDKRSTMTTAEVLTVLLVAARFFGSNIAGAQRFLRAYGYIPHMLSRGRYCRRLHSLGLEFLTDLINFYGSLVKVGQSEFTVDSCPIPLCHNIRIPRCRLIQDEAFRGYCASKKSYFYGVKLHCIATCDGKIVEIYLSPGSWHDCKALKQMELALPEGSTLYADKAYTDYEFEDLLRDAANIDLAAQRKTNHTRQHSGAKQFLINAKRKIIETVFSGISSLLPKKVHAVTLDGFLLKVAALALVSAIPTT